ncbi:MAG: molybdopterin dinucleotide binding domain-containing protein [Rhodocyclaceae bacterium]
MRRLPLIMTSTPGGVRGRGEETARTVAGRAAQDMFVELNPKAAADRGINDRDWVWVKSPTGAQIKVRALVTPRVNDETVFLPFHFSGRWMGEDMLDFYPDGAAPIVRGEAVNTATTYGYDVVTMMQESKTTVCQIVKA